MASKKDDETQPQPQSQPQSQPKFHIGRPNSVIPESLISKAAKDRMAEVLEKLKQAQDLRAVQQTEQRKGRAKDPFVDISDPGHGRSNVGGAAAAKLVAEWRSVPHNFGALRILYSESMQMFVGQPEAEYVKKDKQLCQVSWAKDQKEMRCDMYDALVQYRWDTPDGMIRRVDVYPTAELEQYGPCLVFDMPASTLRPKPVRKSRAKKGEAKSTPPTSAVTDEEDAEE